MTRRYIHVCTSHGVGLPALNKAAAAEIFANKAEQQLQKGRVKPVSTNVAKYVGRKAPGLARALQRILAARRKRIAVLVRERFSAEKLAKDSGKETRLIAQLIEDLESEDLGRDLEGALAPAMLAAFRRAAAIGATQVGFSVAVDQVDKAAVAYAARRGGELIKDLAGTTDKEMRSLLARAVEQGMSADELSTAVEGLGTFSDYRADMIARTELAYAHVRGNVQGWREAGDMVIGKRSILGDLHDVPDICDDIAEAGVVPVDEDFIEGYDLAPYHPNAVFSGRFAPYGRPTRAVAAEYDGPAIALNAGGHRLTIGPNHPMLTSTGMKPAELLEVGDELVCDRRVLNRAGADDTAGLQPDLDQIPLLQDAFDALKATFGYSRIPRTADDFHGDAVFCKGEVEVVFPDRHLLRELQSCGLEAFREQGLIAADVQLVFEPGSGALGYGLRRINLPTPGSVRGGDIDASHFVLLKVESIERTRYVGMAFDYSTDSSLYCVDGFVVSNCMCDVVPVLRDRDAPDDAAD